ncbi:MAG: hypothetical protein K2M79_04490 [Muribaculaceae bacterium]|nr:hypothetical protein [Muribaculaceae bacterium]
MKNRITDILTHIRTIFPGITLAIISMAMIIILSSCAGGRGGIRHHYNSAYGDGVVYYEGYDGYHGHHDNGWHGNKPKKNKHKKSKANKKHNKHKHRIF